MFDRFLDSKPGMNINSVIGMGIPMMMRLFPRQGFSAPKVGDLAMKRSGRIISQNNFSNFICNNWHCRMKGEQGMV